MYVVAIQATRAMELIVQTTMSVAIMHTTVTRMLSALIPREVLIVLVMKASQERVKVVAMLMNAPTTLILVIRMHSVMIQAVVITAAAMKVILEMVPIVRTSMNVKLTVFTSVMLMPPVLMLLVRTIVPVFRDTLEMDTTALKWMSVKESTPVVKMQLVQTPLVHMNVHAR